MHQSRKDLPGLLGRSKRKKRQYINFKRIKMKKIALLLSMIFIMSCGKDDDLPEPDYCNSVQNNGIMYQIIIPPHNYGQPSKAAFIESFKELSVEAAQQFAEDSPCE